MNVRGGVAAVVLALGLHVPLAAQADCDHVGAYIVNLSLDLLDLTNPDICTSLLVDAQIRSCIAQQIDAALDSDCKNDFDVFVPGTAAEHGAWKQFNQMFNNDNNRAHLSLRYQDARGIDTKLNFDPGDYDQGVLDARTSLILLLDALKEEFPGGSIRVFGHSKGAHAVALVADVWRFGDIQFFAFAQPGRTGVDIDEASHIRAGKLGTPGYVQKLSNNLVGITWLNDEVADFYGQGFDVGSGLPERWGFPGFIWQDDPVTFGLAPLRIDHHNNYGGKYTDGIAGNDWQAGEGATVDNYPYCATGDKSAMTDEPECVKQRVDYTPYFWGTPECQATAFRIMSTPGEPEPFFIGYSGPRQPRSCQTRRIPVKADYEIRYRFNLGDVDCRYNMEIGFTDLVTGKKTDSIRFSATEANDNTWRTPNGTVMVPYHMRLSIRAWLTEESTSIFFPDCENYLTESEIFIEYLRLTFIHPGTGDAGDRRTIIGFKEGRGSDLLLKDLHKWQNVAWEQPAQSSEELEMYYSAPSSAIKIEGPTQKDYEGNFQKRVHLLD